MPRSRSSLAGDEVADYIGAHSTPPDPIQHSLMDVTEQATGGAAGMQIGGDQGTFLEIVTRAIGARTAIEIGTFTGYSALSIARGLGPHGRLICCDVSDEWTDIGRRHWEMAGVSERIDLRLAPALDTLHSLDPDLRFDLAFIDADKQNYVNYYEAVLARMTAHGVILVDNTLWGGAVVDGRGDENDGNLAGVRAFNDHVAADQRVQVVMLPIGDGVTMIQLR